MLKRSWFPLAWFLVTLFTAPLAAVAEVQGSSLADALSDTGSPPKPFHCPSLAKGAAPMPLAMQKALQERIDDAEFKVAGLHDNEQTLKKALLAKRIALHGVRTCDRSTTALLHQRDAIASALRKTKLHKQQHDAQFQRMQMCAYRHTLARLVKSPSLTKDEHAMTRKLLRLSRSFSKGKKLASVKARSLSLFRNMYHYYWRQKRLKPHACQLLGQTYRSWASFYESDNRANRTIPASSRRIPLYNGNGHNDSYRVWAWERQKGRIPPQGLTLMHLDTHPDMGGIKDRSPGHWTDQVMTLGAINKALGIKKDSELRAYLTTQLNTAKGFSKAKKAILLADLKATSSNALRQALARQISRRVHNIATPVTAAAYAGLTKKLLLCMPPWSHRFSMSKIDPKTGRSKGITLQLIKKRSNEHIYFGVPNTMAKDPFVDAAEMPSFSMYNPAKRTYQPLSHRIGFHVTACTNEDPSLVDPSEWPSLPRFASYFTPQREGKDGFILGFDLDVFATNGAEFDNHVVPRSYGRDRSLKAALHSVRHHTHDKKHKHPQTSAPLVTALEFKRVKYRLKSVFDRLRTAKRQGYVPRLITIADSTSMGRIYRDGLHRSGVGGGDYVPSCLAFLINYHVKAQLAHLYRGKLHHSIQTLAGRRYTTKTNRKRTPKPQKMRRNTSKRKS